MSSKPSELDAATQEKVVDLFDNEAIWDADDTDRYIVQIFHELEAAGASIATLKDLGWNTLLHTASLWNRPKIMEELIRRGAPLNEKNKNGHTPLDLAMHWGHFDMGQQLRHYGGKHTCEKERDIAISQRDLTQQQLKNFELEYEHMVVSLKHAKQEREQLRIERDRLVVLRAQVVEDCVSLTKQVEACRSVISCLTKESDELHIQAAHLQSELICEQTARNNAVQSWKMVETVIVDLQQMQEECREREEEALRLRNEAIHDRDVARERAKEAQLDQGIAKQNQMEMQRERDQAIERVLQNESEVTHDKEKWRKLTAKIELERRNIQIEIDRQTEILRCENEKLEKTTATLNVAITRQKVDIERSQLTILTLEKQEQVDTLIKERRQEYKAWRAQMEIKMQLELASDLKRVLGAIITTWKSLQSCQQHMTTLSVSAAKPRASSPSRTPAIMSTIFQSQRPHTSATGNSQGLLPFIQEAPLTGLKGSSSTSAIIGHCAEAEASLQELTNGMASEQVVQLCTFVQIFVEDVTAYISANLKRLRRRALAQDKMIERKGELIQRFTHHREEKAKHRSPARYRECSVRPLL
ncbi:uncharacterized protein PITG_06214 [Phytophthora infestans T30-4]|uniref:Uncharacterized protein n=1 Tax=Phytophthora infestans (strain T30-4) TaxID=403677 RepID=D0N4C1_PHYIT|nr:uncharacterized protein PITG_06214 [Phytophthora infestans T30-4]EEY69729.1 conserved hypothetical protein [Phytophthora infestans T30-4]|eukprot:XP_002998376.1 conserved hypothetical protein [Phytophthora infestans T30-4]